VRTSFYVVSRKTQQVGVARTFWTSITEILVANFGRDPGHLEEFLCFLGMSRVI